MYIGKNSLKVSFAFTNQLKANKKFDPGSGRVSRIKASVHILTTSMSTGKKLTSGWGLFMKDRYWSIALK